MPSPRAPLLLPLAVSLLLSPAGCEDEPVDIAATRPCADEAFPMPNPRATGLPNPASYTINADDTVTDNVTKLTWERTVQPVIYRDDPGAPFPVAHNVYNQAEGALRCTAKGSGWRLPTRLELVTLVDFTISEPGPTIDQTAFPNTPVNFPYWTSSPHLGFSTAWAVDFSSAWTLDRINVDDPTKGLMAERQLVRCVRWAVPRCEPDRLQLQDADLAYDAVNQLTWQRYVSDGGPGLPWDDATANCAAFGPGWRLPSLGELQTIVDDTMTTPAIDTTIFPTAPDVVFWTSSPSPTTDRHGEVFGVEFGDGSTYMNFADDLGRVRCVR